MLSMTRNMLIDAAPSVALFLASGAFAAIGLWLRHRPDGHTQFQSICAVVSAVCTVATFVLGVVSRETPLAGPPSSQAEGSGGQITTTVEPPPPTPSSTTTAATAKVPPRASARPAPTSTTPKASAAVKRPAPAVTVRKIANTRKPVVMTLPEDSELRQSGLPSVDQACGLAGEDADAWSPGQHAPHDTDGRVLYAKNIAFQWTCGQNGPKVTRDDLAANCRLHDAGNDAYTWDPNYAYSWFCL